MSHLPVGDVDVSSAEKFVVDPKQGCGDDGLEWKDLGRLCVGVEERITTTGVLDEQNANSDTVCFESFRSSQWHGAWEVPQSAL